MTPSIRGACHCGAVTFRLQLPEGFRDVRRCNCSFCRMRGAVAISAKLDEIEILSGEDRLTLYQFGSRTAKHYFCATCGIYTHHQRRSNPSLYGVNVACLEGVSPFDFTEVPVNDGVDHPADTGAPARLAGILRYQPV
ncbi:GFA family protein [Novosphingobium terrae]|uniref:GFA family protein n=1 Tax=Novosphingobium terrae TaxID=2726189 RepID=UPI00197D98DB|nr:GFA family protein [Novosphingobium terrae]